MVSQFFEKFSLIIQSVEVGNLIEILEVDELDLPLVLQPSLFFNGCESLLMVASALS